MSRAIKIVWSIVGGVLMFVGLGGFQDDLARWIQLLNRIDVDAIAMFIAGDGGRWTFVVVGMTVLLLVHAAPQSLWRRTPTTTDASQETGVQARNNRVALCDYWENDTLFVSVKTYGSTDTYRAHVSTVTGDLNYPSGMFVVDAPIRWRRSDEERVEIVSDGSRDLELLRVRRKVEEGRADTLELAFLEPKGETLLTRMLGAPMTETQIGIRIHDSKELVSESTVVVLVLVWDDKYTLKSYRVEYP